MKNVEKKYDLAELRQWYQENEDKVDGLLQLMKDIKSEQNKLKKLQSEIRKEIPVVVIDHTTDDCNVSYKGNVEVIWLRDNGYSHNEKADYTSFYMRSQKEGKEMDSLLKLAKKVLK